MIHSRVHQGRRETGGFCMGGACAMMPKEAAAAIGRPSWKGRMTEYINELPQQYRDIPLPPGWTRVKRIWKGWSRELKFRVDTRGRQRFLLRVRPNGDILNHQDEFDFVLRLHMAGIRVPRAHVLGLTEQGKSTFMLLDWLEGRDLSLVLPRLPEEEQYSLGLEAGQVLRAIHLTPRRPDRVREKDTRRRALDKVRKFEEAGLQVEGSARVADFVRGHLDWLGALPSVCQHGDFHPGNLVLSKDGRLGVIDFNRWDIGDPAEEFIKVQSFTLEASLPFALGQLHAYFDGDPDQAFWRSLAVHNAVTALYAIRWAKPFGEKEVQGMRQRYLRALMDYRGFNDIVPAWYKGRTDHGIMG